jgi:probable HAF family extracellular repeat protein
MPIYTYASFDDPLATNGTFPLAINGGGQIVGHYDDSSFHIHGFLYIGGTFTTVDDPLGVNGTLPLGRSLGITMTATTTPTAFSSHRCQTRRHLRARRPT